jgi:hypothetical protein
MFPIEMIRAAVAVVLFVFPMTAVVSQNVPYCPPLCFPPTPYIANRFARTNKGFESYVSNNSVPNHSRLQFVQHLTAVWFPYSFAGPEPAWPLRTGRRLVMSTILVIRTPPQAARPSRRHLNRCAVQRRNHFLNLAFVRSAPTELPPGESKRMNN